MKQIILIFLVLPLYGYGQLIKLENAPGSDTTFFYGVESDDEPEAIDSSMLFQEMTNLIEGQFRRHSQLVAESEIQYRHGSRNGTLLNTTFPDSSYFDFTRAKYAARNLGEWTLNKQGDPVVEMEMVQMPNLQLRLQEAGDPAEFGTVFFFATNFIQLRQYIEVDGVVEIADFYEWIPSPGTYFAEMSNGDIYRLKRR